MHVAGDEALLDAELLDAAHGHVLADRGDQLLEAILDGRLAAGEVRGFERRDAAVTHERHLGGFPHEGLELVVARDEVGLRIDLQQGRGVTGGFRRNEALGRHAVGLLGGLRETLLAQPIDGLLDVAAGLVERRLAVHHARAGLVAELLHQGCGDIGHVILSFGSGSAERRSHRASPAR
jgi:hypothetical protein